MADHIFSTGSNTIQVPSWAKSAHVVLVGSGSSQGGGGSLTHGHMTVYPGESLSFSVAGTHSSLMGNRDGSLKYIARAWAGSGANGGAAWEGGPYFYHDGIWPGGDKVGYGGGGAAGYNGPGNSGFGGSGYNGETRIHIDTDGKTLYCGDGGGGVGVEGEGASGYIGVTGGSNGANGALSAFPLHGSGKYSSNGGNGGRYGGGSGQGDPKAATSRNGTAGAGAIAITFSAEPITSPTNELMGEFVSKSDSTNLSHDISDFTSEVVAQAPYIPDYAFTGNGLSGEFIIPTKIDIPFNRTYGEILHATPTPYLGAELQRIHVEILDRFYAEIQSNQITMEVLSDHGVDIATFVMDECVPASEVTSKAYLVTIEIVGLYPCDDSYDCYIIINGELQTKAPGKVVSLELGDAVQFRTTSMPDFGMSKTVTISGDNVFNITFKNKISDIINFLDFGVLSDTLPSMWYPSKTLVVSGLIGTSTIYSFSPRVKLVVNDDEPSVTATVSNGDVLSFYVRGTAPLLYPAPDNYYLYSYGEHGERVEVATLRVFGIQVTDPFLNKGVFLPHDYHYEDKVTETIKYMNDFNADLLPQSKKPSMEFIGEILEQAKKPSMEFKGELLDQARRIVLQNDINLSITRLIVSDTQIPMVQQTGNHAVMDTTIHKVTHDKTFFYDQTFDQLQTNTFVGGSFTSMARVQNITEPNITFDYKLTDNPMVTAVQMIDADVGSSNENRHFTEVITPTIIDGGIKAIVDTRFELGTTLRSEIIDANIEIPVGYEPHSNPALHGVKQVSIIFHDRSNETDTLYSIGTENESHRIGAKHSAKDNTDKVPVDHQYSDDKRATNHYAWYMAWGRGSSTDNIQSPSDFTQRVADNYTVTIVDLNWVAYKPLALRNVDHKYDTPVLGDPIHIKWDVKAQVWSPAYGSPIQMGSYMTSVYYESPIQMGAYATSVYYYSPSQFGQLHTSVWHTTDMNGYVRELSDAIKMNLQPILVDVGKSVFEHQQLPASLTLGVQYEVDFEPVLGERVKTVEVNNESAFIRTNHNKVDYDYVLVQEPVDQTDLLDDVGGYDTIEKVVQYAKSLGLEQNQITLFEHNKKYGFYTDPETVNTVCRVEPPKVRINKVIFWM